MHDCVRTVHLNRDFQALVDRGGAAAPSERWGLAEIERLLTVGVTCRRQGLNLVEFLLAAGEAALQATAAPSLLPAGQGS